MQDQVIREQLANFLKGNQAHMSFEEAVRDFPLSHMNTFFPHGEYTFWHLLEHIRRTQKDILDFMTERRYKEPKWPEDYWPEKSAEATERDWNKTIKMFQEDLKALITLAQDTKIDLSAKVPNGDGQLYMREFMLVIDHNSYEIGEFAIMRQTYNIWNK